MNHYPALRRKRLAGCLQDEQLDALLVSNPTNVTYLTGFSGDSSYLIVGEKQTVLVSDGRFTEQLAEECPDVETYIRPPEQALPKATAMVLDKLGRRAVGFESAHLHVAELETLKELAPATDWKADPKRVEQLRAVKDPTEIEQIKEAIRIAERAFAMFRAMLRPGDCEKDLSDALEMYIRRAGGKGSSFPSIVAVGERSALPHAPPTDRIVGDSPLLLVDWGACGRFYKSDLTRVLLPRNYSIFSRSQREDGKLEKIYAIVRQAQERAIAAVRPGVHAKDVDAAARGAIEEAGFGKYFVHGLGHGIGLQVHEAPAVRANSTDVLQVGNVVTIEPGIYLPGWGGIRLEDDVLITEDGALVLTSVPRDLEASIVDF